MFQPRLPVLLLLAATTALASPAQRGPRLFDQSLNSTWRCGVWIPLPDTKYEEPLAKYFVIQNQIPATCPARFKDTYKKGTFAKHCAKMGEKWESLWSPTDTQKKGPKYGDEVCTVYCNDDHCGAGRCARLWSGSSTCLTSQTKNSRTG